jgi:hypothetical protein
MQIRPKHLTLAVVAFVVGVLTGVNLVETDTLIRWLISLSSQGVAVVLILWLAVEMGKEGANA